MSEELLREKLTSWMNAYSLPPLHHHSREREQAGYEMLQNFLLLLLAHSEPPYPGSQQEALKKFAPEQQWPLSSTASEVALNLGLGQPQSALFRLQRELLETIPDERRAWLWNYGFMS